MHVEDRKAVDVDAELEEIVGDQARQKPGGAPSGFEVRLGELAEHAAGRIGRPDRRRQPLHAAAFLVDQDRRLGPADDLAEIADKLLDLLSRVAIAFEEDEAPGRLGCEECALILAQPQAGAAGNISLA
jgi:hypothetical protein